MPIFPALGSLRHEDHHSEFYIARSYPQRKEEKRGEILAKKENLSKSKERETPKYTTHLESLIEVTRNPPISLYS